MGHVDDRGEARQQPREHVEQAHPARDRHSRVACAVGGEADREEAPAVARAVQPPAESEDRGDQDEELRRQEAAEVALSKEEEARRQAGVVLDAAREALGGAAEERVRAERDDQGRVAEPADHQRVEGAAEERHQQRDRDGERHRHAAVAPERAQRDRGEAHHRSHREIDAAGDDDRRQGQREKPDLDRQARDFHRVGHGQEVAAGHAEQGALEAEQERQHPLAVREEPLGERCGDADRGLSGRWRGHVFPAVRAPGPTRARPG